MKVRQQTHWKVEIYFVKVADTNTPKCFLNSRPSENREYRKDAPRPTSPLDLFHLGPSCGDIGNGETCPMNQIQVNIPHLELRTRASGTVIHNRFFLRRSLWKDCCEWTCQCLGVCTRVLGGDEDIRERKAGFAQGGTDLRPISVHLRGVAQWSHDEHYRPRPQGGSRSGRAQTSPI